jgi:hypothetical protein
MQLDEFEGSITWQFYGKIFKLFELFVVVVVVVLEFELFCWLFDIFDKFV